MVIKLNGIYDEMIADFPDSLEINERETPSALALG